MNELDPLATAMPFAAQLGLHDVLATRDRVQASVAWDPARCTAGGILHGGC
jgi:acyl-coenzyme A thioesterase PaaI-like protein